MTTSYETKQSDLFKQLIEYGIKDEYLANQLVGLISEISKGFANNFQWYPDQHYLNEKISNVKSRIADFEKVNE